MACAWVELECCRNSPSRILQAPEQHDLSGHLLVAFDDAYWRYARAGENHPEVEAGYRVQSVKPQTKRVVHQLLGRIGGRGIGTPSSSVSQSEQDCRVLSGTRDIFHCRTQSFALNPAEVRRREVSA